MADIRCSHPGCGCPISPAEMFCSGRCSKLAAEKEDGACTCGHAGCHH